MFAGLLAIATHLDQSVTYACRVLTESGKMVDVWKTEKTLESMQTVENTANIWIFLAKKNQEKEA